MTPRQSSSSPPGPRRRAVRRAASGRSISAATLPGGGVFDPPPPAPSRITVRWRKRLAAPARWEMRTARTAGGVTSRRTSCSSGPVLADQRCRSQAKKGRRVMTFLPGQRRAPAPPSPSISSAAPFARTILPLASDTRTPSESAPSTCRRRLCSSASPWFASSARVASASASREFSRAVVMRLAIVVRAVTVLGRISRPSSPVATLRIPTSRSPARRGIDTRQEIAPGKPSGSRTGGPREVIHDDRLERLLDAAHRSRGLGEEADALQELGGEAPLDLGHHPPVLLEEDRAHLRPGHVQGDLQQGRRGGASGRAAPA